MRPETKHSAQHLDDSSAARKENTRPGAIDSRTLFRNADVVHIDHQGFTYTLRKTRNGKLILTK